MRVLRLLFSVTVISATTAIGQNIDEPFNGIGLPSGWIVQSGGATVANGVLTLATGCIQLPGSYSRSQGLSIEADITIQNGGIGDFNIWGLYDTLKNNDCHSGPTNGYYTGWYPAGSDNPSDLLNRVSGGNSQGLRSTSARIIANRRYRIKQEFLANGVINTYIDGALTMSVSESVSDNARATGSITLRCWQNVVIDNVRVRSKNIPSLPGQISLVDPVPFQLSGPKVTTDPVVLATFGQPVRGVAADGTARITVRVPTTAAGQQVTLTVLGENSQPSASQDDDGSLETPGATLTGLSILSVTAQNVLGTPTAFAVYRAPQDFAKKNSDASSTAHERTVSLRIEYSQGGTTTIAITVVRPPVIMIHGYHETDDDWADYDLTLRTYGFRFVKATGYTERLGNIIRTDPTYDDPTDLLFNIRRHSLGPIPNAAWVLPKIRKALSSFRVQENVAAVQADVIAHSMGGLVARAIPLGASYRQATNFNAGDLHKLITIGTPHLGTPLPYYVLLDKCVRDILVLNAKRALLGYGYYAPALTSVTLSTGEKLSGGAWDQIGTESGLSDVLRQLRGRSSGLRTAVIQGLVGSEQVVGIDQVKGTKLIRGACLATSTLAQNLTSARWLGFLDPQERGNDGIVLSKSQTNGLAPSKTLTHTHHSSGLEALGFSGAHEYQLGSSGPSRTVELLNRHISATDFATF